MCSVVGVPLYSAVSSYYHPASHMAPPPSCQSNYSLVSNKDTVPYFISQAMAPGVKTNTGLWIPNNKNVRVEKLCSISFFT